jgi:putative FmdB family regulatory protein
MPIYEYACVDCETHFEKLVRDAAPVACPACQGGRVNRLLSLVAVGAGHGAAAAASPMSGGGGGCCGGGCGCR